MSTIFEFQFLIGKVAQESVTMTAMQRICFNSL